MAADFSDERISAYFDGELPADERAAVEDLLANSAEHRSLLQDMAAIRGEFQLLPKLRLGDDFTQRVVAAAVEAAAIEAKTAASSAPLLTPGSVLRKRRFWNSPLVAIPGLAAAALAAVLVAQRSWGPSTTRPPTVTVKPELISTVPAPVEPSATERAIAQLRQATPAQDEALVVRMRVPASTLTDRGVDAALVKGGIRLGRADQAMLANHVGSQYRKKVSSPGGSTVAASDALFVEAPLEQLEATLAELNQRSAAKLDLRLEMIVNAKLPPATDSAEGEGGSGGPLAGSTGPVAHRLNAGMFALSAESSPGLAAPNAVLPAVKLDPRRTVRVLILIEAAE